MNAAGSGGAHRRGRCRGRDPWVDAPPFRLDSVPMLDLGVVEGDSNFMFHRVRGAAGDEP